MRSKSSQRGESKIGCTISLLVFVILVAAAFRIVPVLFSNNEFFNAIESIAGRGAVIPQATIEAQIREKARDLKIPEALVPGAITVAKVGDNQNGTCTVRVKYTRKIDFYGVFAFPLETDKQQSFPYMNAM
jgi:hypothetical protein